MKLSFYFDVFPWGHLGAAFFATTNPSDKPDGATRYRVDVEIPDPALPDVVIAAEPVQEPTDA